MSQESPEYYPPQRSPNGPVVIGVIQFAGESHELLDAEESWLGLRAVVGRWCGVMNEKRTGPLLTCGGPPMPAGRDVTEKIGEQLPR